METICAELRKSEGLAGRSGKDWCSIDCSSRSRESTETAAAWKRCGRPNQKASGKKNKRN